MMGPGFLPSLMITFIYQGATITAELKEIKGAAYPTYYLMVDNYYRGKLWKADTWYWDSIKYPGIKDQLVAVVEKSPD